MPLDPEQEIALQLAGTVGLPCPYPATGRVLIVGPVGAGRRPPEFYLRVEHRLHHRLKISRLVALHDVRAIFACWGADFSPGGAGDVAPGDDWEVKTAGEARDLALARFTDACPDEGEDVFWLRAAIVYVPESAPVLMQVEVGLTAAESASYYPPILGGPAPAHEVEYGLEGPFCRPRPPGHPPRRRDDETPFCPPRWYG